GRRARRHQGAARGHQRGARRPRHPPPARLRRHRGGRAAGRREAADPRPEGGREGGAHPQRGRRRRRL
ncbi:MAG: hypothetical protein AVDCRST_MAG20-2775, partial [uncultured Acidimicrobiales bacterium]